MADRQRAAAAHKVGLANIAASGVELWLGQWVGNGDWAKYDPGTRAAAGMQALKNLDAALEKLTTARNELADALINDGTAALAGQYERDQEAERDGVPRPERQYRGTCERGHTTDLWKKTLEPLTVWPCHDKFCSSMATLTVVESAGVAPEQ